MTPLIYIHGDLNKFHCLVIIKETSSENPNTRNVYLFRRPIPRRTPKMTHFAGDGASIVFINKTIESVHSIISIGFIEKKLLRAGNAGAKHTDNAARA
jgi:hypothetical protein